MKMGLSSGLCRNHCPGDGGSKQLWNVDKCLLDYTVQQPRRQPSLFKRMFGKPQWKWPRRRWEDNIRWIMQK
jgi:hypothetical protein